jgi:hypothetical protein
MSADFDVKAKLTMDSSGAFSGLSRFSNGMGQLGQVMQNNSRLAGGIVSRLVGVAGAYMGLNAVKSVFTGLTAGAVNYTSQLEASKIGLQSILQSVEGGTWEDAGKKAEGAFEAIKDASIKSPASAAEMFSIFNGIVGPIEGAGFAMQKVVDITNDATLAASALNVDYAQTSRDISMMVRGAAGVDVKLFSLLRSTNAITESTEQWNKKLSAAQRVEKLQAALGKFRASGDAFGKSWKGVTSTFQGIREEMGRAAMTPIMGALSTRLDEFNEWFLANQSTLLHRMETYGERVATWIDNAVGVGINGFKWLSAHWVTITDKVERIAALLHANGPKLVEAAKLYAGVSVAGNLGGKALSAGGAVAGAAGGISSMWGALFGGSAAAATGTAAAATGGAAAATGETAALGGSAVAAGAGVGALAAAMAVLAVVISPVVESWDAISASFQGIVGNDMVAQLLDFGKGLWSIIRPILLATGGGVVASLGLALLGIITSVRLLINAFNWLFDAIKPVVDIVQNTLVAVFDTIWQTFAKVSKEVGQALDNIHTRVASDGPLKDKAWEVGENSMEAMMAGFKSGAAAPERAKQVTKVTNDFRGSSFKIDQKFDGDMDPDRIVMAMMGDLNKQAEMRLSSGYAGAFTR